MPFLPPNKTRTTPNLQTSLTFFGNNCPLLNLLVSHYSAPPQLWFIGFDRFESFYQRSHLQCETVVTSLNSRHLSPLFPVFFRCKCSYSYKLNLPTSHFVNTICVQPLAQCRYSISSLVKSYFEVKIENSNCSLICEQIILKLPYCVNKG